MRVQRNAAVVLMALTIGGCAEQSAEVTSPIVVPAFNHAAAASANARGGNFGTKLSGAEEVPANDSRAAGNAIFKLNAAGTELSYKLIVANIENVFQAHIHAAPAGSNGGVVVWLYPSTSPPAGPAGQGRIDGVIAEGVLTAANLMGSLANQPLSALVDLMKAGGAYVNVHTNDGVAPTNTGPGDLSAGEIRGQIEHRGH